MVDGQRKRVIHVSFLLSCSSLHSNTRNTSIYHYFLFGNVQICVFTSFSCERCDLILISKHSKTLKSEGSVCAWPLSVCAFRLENEQTFKVQRTTLTTCTLLMMSKWKVVKWHWQRAELLCLNENQRWRLSVQYVRCVWYLISRNVSLKHILLVQTCPSKTNQMCSSVETEIIS